MPIELESRDDGTTDRIETLADLDEAFDRLEAAADAQEPMLVTLYREDGRSLSVGLGHDGTALSLTGPDGMGPFHVSENGSGDETPVRFLSGGVWTDFPGWSLVARPDARRAIRHFFQSGEPAPDLDWRPG
jgi:hypothetical protein